MLFQVHGASRGQFGIHTQTKSFPSPCCYDRGHLTALGGVRGRGGVRGDGKGRCRFHPQEGETTQEVRTGCRSQHLPCVSQCSREAQDEEAACSANAVGTGPAAYVHTPGLLLSQGCSTPLGVGRSLNSSQRTRHKLALDKGFTKCLWSSRVGHTRCLSRCPAPKEIKPTPALVRGASPSVLGVRGCPC